MSAAWQHDRTGRAERGLIHTCGARTADTGWTKATTELARCESLPVIALTPAVPQPPAALAGRTMRLQLTIHEGEAWLTSCETRFAIGREWGTGSADPPGRFA